MEGVKFWTKVKTITQKWPDGSAAGDHKEAFVIPIMEADPCDTDVILKRFEHPDSPRVSEGKVRVGDAWRHDDRAGHLPAGRKWSVDVGIRTAEVARSSMSEW